VLCKKNIKYFSFQDSIQQFVEKGLKKPPKNNTSPKK
jgi:hypothetical protein